MLYLLTAELQLNPIRPYSLFWSLTIGKDELYFINIWRFYGNNLGKRKNQYFHKFGGWDHQFSLETAGFLHLQWRRHYPSSCNRAEYPQDALLRGSLLPLERIQHLYKITGVPYQRRSRVDRGGGHLQNSLSILRFFWRRFDHHRTHHVKSWESAKGAHVLPSTFTCDVVKVWTVASL